MILREFFYKDEETGDFEDDKRYDPVHDKLSTLERGDTRKTRLSLKQINRVRRASEAQDKERRKELDSVKRMYSAASNSEEGL